MLATRKFDIGIRISALDTLDDRCTADSAGTALDAAAIYGDGAGGR